MSLVSPFDGAVFHTVRITDFQRAMQFKLYPARNCEARMLFFRSLFGMDDADRTALLRFMAQQAATL